MTDIDELCHVTTTSFHDELGSEKYPMEAGRYWLFTSRLCPFAHRAEITRSLKGLKGVIGHTIVDPVQTEKGWNIGERYQHPDSAPGPIEGFDRLPDYYELSAPGYDGRCSVPVLFDTKTNKIVNTESAEISQQFDRLNTDTSLPNELSPDGLRGEIGKMIEFLNDEFISPIYRAGFSKSQSSYQENFDRVFAALDVLDLHLASSKSFLIGDKLTLADVHAYPHLSRFDGAYHMLYKVNRAFIRDYKNISAYLVRVAAVQGFGDTLDIDAMKRGYFLSWNQPTEGGFVPVGPKVDPQTGVALAPKTTVY